MSVDAYAATEHGGSPPASESASLPERIAARYALGESLGRGGMGEVFAARDVNSGEALAVKVVRRSESTAHSVERLLREATAAGRISHAGVVRVLDAGIDETHGIAFIAQELLVGETLRARLERDGRLPHIDAVALALQVADALIAAHEAGVVHRDLKPENIFLEGDSGARRVRVIDFGIARLVASEDLARTQLTTTGAVLGTPTYMSPEQARGGDDVDEQTDVWALAVMLYEMLTGATPFRRATPHATLAAILLDPVASPNEAAADTPAPVATVVLRALQRNRVERFGTMREFADALRAASVSAVDASAAITKPPPVTAINARPRRVAPIALVGIAFAALAALALAAPRPQHATAISAVIAPVSRAAPTVARASAASDAPPRVVETTAIVATPQRLAPALPRGSASVPLSIASPRSRPHLPAPRATPTFPDAREFSLPSRRTNGAPIVGL